MCAAPFSGAPPSLLVLAAARAPAAGAAAAALSAALHRSALAIVRASHAAAAAPPAPDAGLGASAAPAQRQSAAAEALVLVPAWCAGDALPAARALPALLRRPWAAAPAAEAATQGHRLAYARAIAHYHAALERVHLVSVASLADANALLARLHAAAPAPAPAAAAAAVAAAAGAAADDDTLSMTADGAQTWRVLEILPARAPAAAAARAPLPAAPTVIVLHGFDSLVERATCGGSGGGDGSLQGDAPAAAAGGGWRSAASLSAAARCVALASAALARSAELWQALAAAAVQRGGAPEAEMAAAAAALPRCELFLTFVTPHARAELLPRPPPPLARMLARLGACLRGVDDRGAEEEEAEFGLQGGAAEEPEAET
jgi:hypothetical protein